MHHQLLKINDLRRHPRPQHRQARRILEDMDFIVDEAEDGQEAFDKCRQEMPDAILLDWHMPIMGGLEFLKLLRAYVGGGAPKVVFCVTENDIGQIALAKKAGANELMMKPFDRDILESMFTDETAQRQAS
jgi:two-component system chemotaxis response regulator CheY